MVGKFGKTSSKSQFKIDFVRLFFPRRVFVKNARKKIGGLDKKPYLSNQSPAMKNSCRSKKPRPGRQQKKGGHQFQMGMPLPGIDKKGGGLFVGAMLT